MSYPTPRRHAPVHFVLALSLAMLSTDYLAQDSATYRPNFYGVPLSDYLVEGEVLLQSDKVVYVAREGTAVTIKAKDYHYAFTHKLAADDSVNMTLYKITIVPGPEGGEAALEPEVAKAPIRQIAPLTGELPFDIRVTSIGVHKSSSAVYRNEPVNPQALRKSKPAVCCARACDSTIVCASAVATSCSSCTTVDFHSSLITAAPQGLNVPKPTPK